MAVRTRQRCLHLRDAHRHHADRAGLQAGVAASPAIRCSRTRPSSAPMPSPTNPASIRTACSSTAKPTKSCAPRTSAGAQNKLVLGKHSGPQRLQDPPAGTGHRAGQRRGAQRRLRPLQGTGRQEARNLRRRPAGAGVATKLLTPEHEHFKLVSFAGLLGNRRDAACRGDPGGRRRGAAGARPTAAGRSTRPSRRSRASSRAAPSCCCTRSTTSPAAPMPRAK